MVAADIQWIAEQDRTFLFMQAARRNEQVLNRMGLTFEAVSGDVEFTPVHGNERETFTPYHSDQHFDKTPDNFIVFRLRDEIGRVRAQQAARFEDIGRLTLSQFHRRQLERVHKLEGARVDPYHSNPALEMISGRIVYHGDVLCSKNPRLPSGALEAFCVVSMMISQNKWDHDFGWAMVNKRNARGGIAERFKMVHSYPVATLWKDIPEFRGREDYICFNSRSDVEYLAKVALIDDLWRESE